MNTPTRFIFLRHGCKMAAFSLIELLMVITIIIVMMTFLVPAFNGIQGGRDVTKAAYDIAGDLEQARTYAMANNTYVWVGFYEEDGSQLSTNPAKAGTGRLVMSVVASQNGERYSDSTVNASTPAAFGTGAPSNTVNLVQISKLIKVSNVHAGTLNDGLSSNSLNNPKRPPVQPAYQVGDTTFGGHVNAPSLNPTSFTYPLAIAGSTQTPQYTFTKIIEFNPQGEASKIVENVFTGPGPQDRMEIAFQPTHGSSLDARYTGINSTKAGAVVQVEGITGQVQMFKP